MLPLLVVFALAAQTPPSGPTLSGVVRDASGNPVPKATVFIRTAAPRKGIGVL
jgi:hypothetical protein